MKSDYKVIAKVSKKSKKRGMFFVGIVALFCIAALILSVVSFVSGNGVFGVSYIIAAIFGVAYVIIKYNQYFSTYIASDGENIIMKCWENFFFPYDAWGKVPFIRDFIPAKSQEYVIPMDEISQIVIGGKSYVKRHADDEEFNNAVRPYEKQKYSAVSQMLEKSNIIFIKTWEGDRCFMSIMDFDPGETMKVINAFTRDCADDVDVKINSRQFKRYLKRPIPQDDDNPPYDI